MATKAVNMRWDENFLSEIKNVTSIFHMTLTEFLHEAAEDKMKELKADPLYRLTVNVSDASAEETAEDRLSCKLRNKRQQGGLHPANRPKWKIGPTDTPALAERNIRHGVPDEVDIPHQNSPPKY